MSIILLVKLQYLKASGLLPPRARGKNLSTDLSGLISSVRSHDFDFDYIIPLLKVAVDDASEDTVIWLRAYDAVTERTPPPRPIATSVTQTPWRHNTGSFANSSEYRKYIDHVLKEELGPLYVGVRGFYERFFGSVAGLKTASEDVLKKCMEGSSPLLGDPGWVGWPKDANQDEVLSWLAKTIEHFATLAESHQTTPKVPRRPLAQPNKPIPGSTAERKIDVGLVSVPNAGQNSLCHWRQILVPGELKSNPATDTASKAWLDLGRYAREVLAAQDNRRYVLGFTLCGSFMRVWLFDRLGGIASDRFDIHKDAIRFVSTIIGFLWMTNEQLGFDPTILTIDGQRCIEIERNGLTERLIIDKVIRRAPCIAGRATTTWKAYHGSHPHQPLVIKDSWQYLERMEEGEILRETTDKSVTNVARYYHHETVRVFGADDDVRGNVRKGLDITTADNYRVANLTPESTSAADDPQKDGSIAGVKRTSSQTGVALSPSKRRRYSQSQTTASNMDLSNRIRRRIVMMDYGDPIYHASSHVALCRAFQGCIEGHKSLRDKAEFLHRDISINNMMINEDSNNPSRPAFLIDLDFSIKESRMRASGAKGKTGTKVFMAIGALLGEQHSFMHDLESFFWVLCWICIHYNGPGQGKAKPDFDKWNYFSMQELAAFKAGVVSGDVIFRETITAYFTDYYKPLIPCVSNLRQVVFPQGIRWEAEDEGLYSSMINVFLAAQQTI